LSCKENGWAAGRRGAKTSFKASKGKNSILGGKDEN